MWRGFLHDKREFQEGSRRNPFTTYVIESKFIYVCKSDHTNVTVTMKNVSPSPSVQALSFTYSSAKGVQGLLRNQLQDCSFAPLY